MRKALIAITGVGLMLLIPLLAVEAGLRLLPVNSGLGTQPVNANDPVYRFAANRSFVYSKDWDFALVNRGRVNNAGFVNDRDYAPEAPGALIAVVGDSFVEALMVPFAQTLSGQLADAVADTGRVYSFAASGAPLSQYLVWIDHARRVYRPQGFVVVVVGNDFDESLRAYKDAPGFHYYQRAPDGALALTRIDYAPGLARRALAASALGRYLYMNAQVTYRWPMLWRAALGLFRDEPPRTFVANTDAATNSARLAMSEEAVEAFFRDLPAASGVPPERIHFVVDGLRYPADVTPATDGSYFVRMRSYFLARARAMGHPTTDMQPLFLARHARDGARFDFLPVDEHWNATAHALAAEAVMTGPVFKQVFAKPQTMIRSD